MAYLSPLLTQISGAVKKTATVLTRDFNELEHLQNTTQGDQMFALRAYEKAEKILREELSKIRPDYAIITDQNTDLTAAKNCFVVAPIDGFVNFAHGNGAFAVSVAMIESGILTIGVIYNPIYDELFFAEKGNGAFKEGFRNHERLRLSGRKNAAKALVACSADEKILSRVLAMTPYVCISGSTALDLAHLAGGKTDAVIATQGNSLAVAAGALLVKEAGGYVFAVGAKDIRSENMMQILQNGKIAATNEALRQKIADILA